MKRAVPHRLYSLTHPLEAFLLRFARSTACRVLDVHGFGVTNVLSRTSHDPYIIWSFISLRNPWTIWTCKTVGPFNLNRGQDLSLPSVKPTDAFSASTSSTDVGHMRGINRPVRGPVIAGSAPTSPNNVTGHFDALLPNRWHRAQRGLRGSVSRTSWQTGQGHRFINPRNRAYLI